MSDHDLERLVERTADGEQDAFARLYDEIVPLVYGIARRVVRDPSLAEDVTQDVFVELWRQANRFDASRGRAVTWAATIAHRRAIDRVRHEQRYRDLDAQRGTDHLPDVASPEDAAIDGADGHRVVGGLARLTPHQREVLRLAYFDGLTQRQIADLLGIPLGTAKTRTRDGLIALRRILADQR